MRTMGRITLFDTMPWYQNTFEKQAEFPRCLITNMKNSRKSKRHLKHGQKFPLFDRQNEDVNRIGRI